MANERAHTLIEFTRALCTSQYSMKEMRKSMKMIYNRSSSKLHASICDRNLMQSIIVF